MRRFFILMFVVTLFSGGQSTNANNFDVEVANENIGVTVGFTGSSVELFGDKRNKDADVAIIVEGPRKDITIWKKARVMGTWVNRYYMTFSDMPVYYQYATTIDGELDDNLDLIMRHNGIGHEALFASMDIKKSKSIDDTAPFKKTLLEKKSERGIYFKDPAEIKFINDYFFRVRFDIPASAQTGEYKIRSYLIEDGKVTEQRVDTLLVKQVGMNAFIYQMAKQHSLVYAMICILLALFCGWFASVVRVRP